MALKRILESLDGVPEPLHDEYEEKDGKFYLKPIEGLKPVEEFNVVHRALSKEREEHKTTKTKLVSFGDLNPDEVRAQLDQIEELRVLAEGKVDDAKINQLVESRLRVKLAPVERERDQLKTQNLELGQTVETFKGRDRTRTIVDAVQQAARAAKVVDTAIEDVTILAERMFDVQDGTVVTKDNVGVTPGMDPASWLTDMLQKRPHWLPPSKGGGGRQGNGEGGANPWSANAWNMTEQGRVYKADPAKAERLAKAAGSKVGAISPPEK
jgi:hypothetical protein